MKKVKKNIALILYRIILIFVKIIPAKQGSKHLLLIKVDEIGDYILFRNYFKHFRHSEKYSGYKITIVGNKAWKSLYDEYDRGIVDDVMWLDKTKYKKDLFYRFSFLYKIRKIKSSDVVNCIYSRSIDLDDGIAAVATGNKKIAMHGDTTNRVIKAENHDKNIYSEIIDAGDITMFDAVRNRNFTEEVLGIKGIAADIKLPIVFKNELPAEDYFVIFIGAGNPERRWPIPYFIDCVKYAVKKYNLIPIVCGGPGDEADAAIFADTYQGRVLNYAGKTSLPFMVELMSKSKFLICVDTGALHMGVAAGCAVIGLFSGKFYGRFAPYPREITENFYAVYPDFVDELIAKNDPVLYDTSVMKNDTMKMIPPYKVIPCIQNIML